MDDSRNLTPSGRVIFISLATFSTTILNAIGDVASPRLNPDLTTNWIRVYIPNLNFDTNVSKMLMPTSFMSLS